MKYFIYESFFTSYPAPRNAFRSMPGRKPFAHISLLLSSNKTRCGNSKDDKQDAQGLQRVKADVKKEEGGNNRYCRFHRGGNGGLGFTEVMEARIIAGKSPPRCRR